MSTVPEVIAAAQMGIRVLAISCITNMAAGITDHPIIPQEVFEAGSRVKGQFIGLLQAVIPRLVSDLNSSQTTKQKSLALRSCVVDRMRRRASHD